jgi:hypothetical protein
MLPTENDFSQKNPSWKELQTCDIRAKRCPLVVTSDQFHYHGIKLAYFTGIVEIMSNSITFTHTLECCLNKYLLSLASRSGTEMTCREQ